MITKEPSLISEEMGVNATYTLEVLDLDSPTPRTHEECVDFTDSYIKVYSQAVVETETGVQVKDYEYYYFAKGISAIRYSMKRDDYGVRYVVSVFSDSSVHNFWMNDELQAKHLAYLLTQWRAEFYEKAYQTLLV